MKSEEATDAVAEEGESEGRVWRIQAHARNSISCMKVDPINGSGVSCSWSLCEDVLIARCSRHRTTVLYGISILRHYNPGRYSHLMTRIFSSIISISPQMVKRLGWQIRMVVSAMRTLGIGRAGNDGDGLYKRKVALPNWEVSLSIVRPVAENAGNNLLALMPHLLVTAGNDQHLRIWDTRQLSSINPIAADIMIPPPSIKSEGANEDALNTRPTSSISSDRMEEYRSKAKGKGLLRASFQHGKSCSSAYWDPWGRRILSTSYDDKLRSACKASLS